MLLRNLAVDSCTGEVITNVLKAIDSGEPSKETKCTQKPTELASQVESGLLILGTVNSSL
jgi:hypothetical protein